jgi:Tfp pilus assembly protein PilF
MVLILVGLITAAIKMPCAAYQVKSGKSHGSHSHVGGNPLEPHFKPTFKNHPPGQSFIRGQSGWDVSVVVVPMQFGATGFDGVGYWGPQWQDLYAGGVDYEPLPMDRNFSYNSNPWGYGAANHLIPGWGYAPPPGYQALSPALINPPIVGLVGPEVDGSVVAPQPSAYPTILTRARARSAQKRAEDAFRRGDYQLANSLARQVVTLDSDNGAARLFSAHTSFAIGDYEAAAEDLRTALYLLPNEQWDFVVKNFRHFYGRNDYVIQMQQLDQFISDRPVHIAARMVRGHQWVCLGHLDSADQDISIALAKRANDEALRRLLEWINLRAAASQGLSAQQPTIQLGPIEPMQIEFDSPVEPPPTVPNSAQPELPSVESPSVGTLPAPGETELESLDDFDLPNRK